MGEVFFAGLILINKKRRNGAVAALLRVVVADGAAQHGIAGLERVEDRAQRDRAMEGRVTRITLIRKAAGGAIICCFGRGAYAVRGFSRVQRRRPTRPFLSPR